jgi:hypothetical protein
MSEEVETGAAQDAASAAGNTGVATGNTLGSQPQKKLIGRSAPGKKAPKVKEPVVYDRSDLSKPFPENYEMYCEKDDIYRLVQILDIKVKTDPLVPYHLREIPNANAGTNASANASTASAASSVSGKNSEKDVYANHQYVYYVHYIRWDRRMDEWVKRDRLRFSDQVKESDKAGSLDPRLNSNGNNKSNGQKSSQKKAGGEQDMDDNNEDDGPSAIQAVAENKDEAYHQAQLGKHLYIIMDQLLMNCIHSTSERKQKFDIDFNRFLVNLLIESFCILF